MASLSWQALDANGHLATGRDLVAQHFLMEEERPPELDPIDIAALDPCLRTLLFTDGTVTRTLEVMTLDEVSIDVLHEDMRTVPDHAARCLGLDGGEAAVERRVKMRIGDCRTPVVWAESYIIPERLPEDFLNVLHGSPDGLGESLQQLMLENARELLWYGFGATPTWAEDAPTRHGLTRLYRVTTHRQPALLISECFAVELASGAYRLAWPTVAAA